MLVKVNISALANDWEDARRERCLGNCAASYWHFMEITKEALGQEKIALLEKRDGKFNLIAAGGRWSYNDAPKGSYRAI